jgi:hypothetical protein
VFKPPQEKKQEQTHDRSLEAVSMTDATLKLNLWRAGAAHTCEPTGDHRGASGFVEPFKKGK